MIDFIAFALLQIAIACGYNPTPSNENNVNPSAERVGSGGWGNDVTTQRVGSGGWGNDVTGK